MQSLTHNELVADESRRDIMSDLSGRTTIVVGASRGLGRRSVQLVKSYPVTTVAPDYLLTGIGLQKLP